MTQRLRKGIAVNALLVLAIVVIVGIALGLDSRRTPGADQRFIGTDSAATSRIEADHPDYKPWFKPLFIPAPGGVESGLFALQAALGGTALGYTIGALRGRRRNEIAASHVEIQS
jgi:cobalt/nickel transport protein